MAYHCNLKVCKNMPMNRRPNITEGLKTLKCRTLIFVGENSPFYSEALHMTAKLDRRYSALVEVCFLIFHFSCGLYISIVKFQLCCKLCTSPYSSLRFRLVWIALILAFVFRLFPFGSLDLVWNSILIVIYIYICIYINCVLSG